MALSKIVINYEKLFRFKKETIQICSHIYLHFLSAMTLKIQVYTIITFNLECTNKKTLTANIKVKHSGDSRNDLYFSSINNKIAVFFFRINIVGIYLINK